MFAPKVG